MKKFFLPLTVLGVSIFGFMIIKNPEICTNSTISGILICGRVIIPSLFPFTFCVLFILKSGILKTLKITESVSVFLLSLIGGYPLGAKMIKESNIDEKEKPKMLNFCVNAGPAFIILAVGNGIYESRKIGVLLFFAHVLPSFILGLIFRKSFNETQKAPKNLTPDLIDNFTECAALSSATIISICSYVILFSVIMGYINQYDEFSPILKALSLILEVTNGLYKTHNIYLSSALLGFGGLCVWCQVFSLSKGIKINLPLFILCRIFHALSSVFLVFVFVRVFGISIPVLSNTSTLTTLPFQSTAAVGISLILMGIVFIISIQNKNFAGNILEDMI